MPNLYAGNAQKHTRPICRHHPFHKHTLTCATGRPAHPNSQASFPGICIMEFVVFAIRRQVQIPRLEWAVVLLSRQKSIRTQKKALSKSFLRLSSLCRQGSQTKALQRRDRSQQELSQTGFQLGPCIQLQTGHPFAGLGGGQKSPSSGSNSH